MTNFNLFKVICFRSSKTREVYKAFESGKLSQFEAYVLVALHSLSK